MAKIVSKHKAPWMISDPPSRAKSEGAAKSDGKKRMDGQVKPSAKPKAAAGKSTGTGKPKAAGASGGSSSMKPVREITDQQILELLLEDVFEEPTDYGAVKIQSFAKAGIKSAQPGVLVTMDDGTAYQIIIQKQK